MVTSARFPPPTTSREAVLLVNFRPETNWFKPLRDYPMIVPNKVLRFVRLDGRKAGRVKCAQALLYFGPRADEFIRVFGQVGEAFEPRMP